jgi:hypothetical protein
MKGNEDQCGTFGMAKFAAAAQSFRSNAYVLELRPTRRRAEFQLRIRLPHFRASRQSFSPPRPELPANMSRPCNRARVILRLPWHRGGAWQRKRAKLRRSAIRGDRFIPHPETRKDVRRHMQRVRHPRRDRIICLGCGQAALSELRIIVGMDQVMNDPGMVRVLFPEFFQDAWQPQAASTSSCR